MSTPSDGPAIRITTMMRTTMAATTTTATRTATCPAVWSASTSATERCCCATTAPAARSRWTCARPPAAADPTSAATASRGRGRGTAGTSTRTASTASGSIEDLLEARPQPLRFAPPLFRLEPRLFGGAARARFPAQLLLGQRIVEDLFEPRQRAVAVGELAPLRLRRHAQHPFLVDPPGEPFAHARLLRVVERQRVDVDLDRHARLHLIHVLPARAAAARRDDAVVQLPDVHAVRTAASIPHAACRAAPPE